ncbi:MAG: hypothetical protein A2047_02375 [Omnitrophica bacterium GWA2_41_15]|nr:MAG: hypothetical protein A2047_02375 [Omnitrophica bacterium GWA2_41_15]HAZ10560.1 hypothetical protein [Candidatus Omnitrophota bacterium]
MNAFVKVLDKHNVKYKDMLRRERLTTLQANMGNLCNQSCLHCHMNASPQGKNIMSRKRVNDILKYLSEHKGLILDITGGAPELNPNFDYLVKSARSLVNEIIVRSNLTVIFEPGSEHLPNFFKENRVHLICSLPCYTKENVDRQRGKGIFEKSLKALRILNELGYGKVNELQLDLAHNPIGPNLPLEQHRLEIDYKRNLNKEYGIGFNRLITITNVPLGRFNDYLETNRAYEKYNNLLKDNFNAGVLGNLMCRTFLSVDWDGRLYDCDFNLVLGLALKDADGRILTIDTISPVELEAKEIIFGEHCLACAAGSGSSCQGALDLPCPCAQGRGLLKLDTVRQNVKYFYQDAALRPKKELCCPATYEKEDMSYIPKEALEVSYGCGSPISIAQPAQGEAVVDLGCGAGIDCFIAAKKVGIPGKVIGVDMTEEMLQKANKALEHVSSNLGFLNCEFRHGFLEDVPVESESIDLVTSNCVLNLSSDKSKVFKEIYRILKDGGRFVISDVVSNKEVPVFMKNNQELWGECISGALTQNEFLSKAKDAGFYALEILKNFKYKEVEGLQFYSITVRGYKSKKNKTCC